MIPLKLHIKNFLSYGSDAQVIDFSPYNLICLSGKNGHGKSALLDAITWALWGQARKTFGTAKADQGLLRLGQTQMFVMLDFVFNGQTYRVRREFAKTYGKPHASLDFGLLNPETDELIPLTDKTIRATQEKIESLLNLDIESFVNSAFLRQGQSNEFSKKTAKERKNVLATILGLNRYEHLRTLALEKVKQAYTKKDTIHALQQNVEQELQQSEKIATLIAESTSKLTTLTDQEKILDREKETLNQQQALFAQEQQALQLLTFKKEQAELFHNAKRDTLQSLFKQWRATHKQLLQLPDQHDIEERKRACLEKLNNHQLTLQKSLELKERSLTALQQAHTLEKQIQQEAAATLAAQKLAHEKLLLEQKILDTSESETSKQMLALDKEYTAVKQTIIDDQKKLLAYAEQLLLLETLEKQFERRKEYYQKFVTQGNWVKKELEALAQKNTLALDDDNPSCPLCEQNLSAHRKRFLKKHFEQNEQFLTHRITRLRTVTLKLKALLIDQHAHISTLKKIATESNALSVSLEERLKQQQKLETTRAQLQLSQEKLIQQKVVAAQQAEFLLKELTALQQHEQHLVQSHEPYQKLMSTLAALEQEQKSIAYNQQHHQETIQQLQTLEQQLQAYASIAQTQTLQQQRATSIKELCEALKNNHRVLQELYAALKPYESLSQKLQMLAAAQEQNAKKYQDLKQQKEALLQEKGSLENQHQKLLVLKKDHHANEQTLKTLDTLINDYQTIATATGKEGIQALLIEEAIPEIEQEANTLLAKLTNNQAQIFIESVRDLKSGGTKETLDIKISDAIGIRPYEMFSGGEAFRIDFALRIAISKLLARRAGTSLQTLIIDEGFGSQDEEGLYTIMDALYKIQEDFSKVIIVSHLPTMKDQFPVHFYVEKGPNGSQVRVMEQG